MDGEMTQLVLALKIIKSECDKWESCENCPLRGGDGTYPVCGVLKNKPHEWEIADPQKWRAFK